MFNKNADSESLRDALREHAKALVSPRSYFSGACADETALPDNVIVFSRSGGLNASTRSFHNRFVLLCCVEGQGDVVLDGTAFRFMPGAALLIHPFQFHQYANIPGDAMLWVFITFDFPQPDVLLPLRNAPAMLSPSGWQEVGLLVERFLQTASGRSPAGRSIAMRLRLVLDEMIAALGKRGLRMQPLKDRFLPDVCAHIHAHLGEALGVSDIAHALSISESHLRNRFRQATGGGIGSYVRRARLHRACSLMHTSNATLSEVATACGFDSLYSFSRAFKQAFGESPSSWRERTAAAFDPEGHDPS